MDLPTGRAEEMDPVAAPTRRSPPAATTTDPGAKGADLPVEHMKELDPVAAPAGRSS